MTMTCPSNDQLLQYLAEEDCENVELDTHVDSCDECQSAIEALSDCRMLNRYSSAIAPDAETAVGLADCDTVVANRLEKIARQSKRQKPDRDLPETLEPIGPYELIMPIGDGGMGKTFLACNQTSSRECVVKLLNGNRAENNSVLRECKRQMKTLWKLGLSTLGMPSRIENVEGTTVLVMGYEKGVDLRAWVKDHGPLSVQDACRAASHAAITLHQVHSAKLTHLDVKPANLFRTHDGGLHVLDCGLAPLVKDELVGVDLMASQFLASSIDFLSPEQTRNVEQADHRSDIYSLGCSLVFLLSGRELFHGGTVTQKMVAHRETEIPATGQMGKDIPSPLGPVLQKMLAKKPADRYRSMIDVATALQPFWGEQAEDDFLTVPVLPKGGGIKGWIEAITKRK